MFTYIGIFLAIVGVTLSYVNLKKSRRVDQERISQVTDYEAIAQLIEANKPATLTILTCPRAEIWRAFLLAEALAKDPSKHFDVTMYLYYKKQIQVQAKLKELEYPRY